MSQSYKKFTGILSRFAESGNSNHSHLFDLASDFESSTGLFIIKEHVKVSNFWTVSGKFLIVDSERNILFTTDISVSSLETFLRTFELIRNNFGKV